MSAIEAIVVIVLFGGLAAMVRRFIRTRSR